ncbi:beta-ketoacyl-[acyl-carrier-protein] synthase family protein [Chimaeribacter arupi]|uniref:beta-ketoacyl-[acyl-carrier-protein] synthase family protein n=1 Tax=Chimaeribacter arupi TaxID=2060066 RepID=UPI000C7D6106|nr:beta-ketoacyl-[acyl-carrier-protein] synthase family protein [Chimaeribacter arupi]PLR46662.1 beta-ketoacyl-[acyl-carrier-protein] synthase family protein [Chimaeribacter arupi]
MSTPSRRVVVTGYGAVTPLGNSAEQSWAGIMAGHIGYRRVDRQAAGIASHFYGLADPKPDIAFLPAAIRRRLPRFAQLALVSAREAMAMAFGDRPVAEVYDPLACGAIIGTGWAGLDEALENYDQYQQSGMGSMFGCFLTMPNVATAACSQFWGLRGYQATPVAACATGTLAIGDAFEVIRSGRADMMLAGGAESLTKDNSIWNIDVLNALTPEQDDPARACCPFSLDRSGFVLSEGGAVLCLEERGAALARGAAILGEITGYGNYSDAVNFTAPAADKIPRTKAIRAALAQAGLAPEALGYINAHGTSTPLNDLNESDAIKMALGDAAYTIPISSTKSYTGHMIAAAGSFEAIVCLKALAEQVMPATAHLRRPDPQCDLDYIAEGHRAARFDHTLNLSFGFGGANAALILSRGQA